MANSPWHTNVVTKAQWKTQRSLLTQLYDRLGVARVRYSLPQLKQDFPDSANPEKSVNVFLAAGVLTRELERGGAMVTSYWTLTQPTPEAGDLMLSTYQQRVEKERIDTNVANKGKKAQARLRKVMAKPVAVTPKSVTFEATIADEKSSEETRAIAGPDRESAFLALAPLRRNEAAALVEAARQYANRDHTITTQLDQMEAAMKAIGVTFDRSTVQGAVTIERDERLESVALVLPYITELENRFVRVTGDLTQFRQRLAEVPQLKTALEQKTKQIDRLIAERDAERRRG